MSNILRELRDDVKALISHYLTYPCNDCKKTIHHAKVRTCVRAYRHSVGWLSTGDAVCNYGYLCVTCHAKALKYGGFCDQCCWNDVS